MDRDHTPSALDTELFEESGCDDSVATSVGVWVQKRTADDAYNHNGKAAAEFLRQITNDGAA